MHLEALKFGMQPMAQRGNAIRWRGACSAWALGLAGTIVALGAIYYVIESVRRRCSAPQRRGCSGALLLALYVCCIG